MSCYFSSSVNEFFCCPDVFACRVNVCVHHPNDSDNSVNVSVDRADVSGNRPSDVKIQVDDPAIRVNGYI